MTSPTTPAGEGTASDGRVALVHDWLTGMRGGEKVLEACAELYPSAPIYTLFHFPGTVSEALEAHPIETSFLQRAPGLRRHYRSYLPLFPAAIESLDLTPYPLVVSTSHCVAKGIIPGPEARHVCYCHTPMRYAWDQEAAYFPRRRGVVARLRGFALTALRTWDVSSSARVDHFLANSTFVAERIRRFYRRDAEVVAPPVDTDFFTPGEPLAEAQEPYLLTVAALAPYKRVDLAIAAAARLGMRLVVVGDGPERARLASHGDARTEFRGRVTDDELRALYRGAAAFVQPGVEDFGIAAVESLACGTPVVARGRGGVLDIVRQGEHGWLYDPAPGDDPLAALVEAISCARQRSFDKMTLRAQAEHFSPQRFQERLSEALTRSSQSK
jgi:glycosyltransferase involved in cell wall biosynthesis